MATRAKGSPASKLPDRSTNRHHRRLRVSIVGAGKVGQTMGRLANLAGYDIGDVVCRSKRSALRAAQFIGSGTPQAGRIKLSPADIIIISTPDDKIPDAVSLILNNNQSTPRAIPTNNTSVRGSGFRRIAPIVIHTSGAVSSAALEPLKSLGVSVASFHPLQTFQSPTRALDLLGDSYFCLEGDVEAKRASRRLARDIGAHYFEIPTKMKSLYHAAAVMASGGLIALLSISLEILGRCGLDRKTARQVLLPLIQGAVANLGAVGPSRAMTGPVVRRDLGTIERNRAALATLDPGWLAIYDLLTDRGLQLVQSSGSNNLQML